MTEHHHLMFAPSLLLRKWVAFGFHTFGMGTWGLPIEAVEAKAIACTYSHVIAAIADYGICYCICVCKRHVLNFTTLRTQCGYPFLKHVPKLQKPMHPEHSPFFCCIGYSRLSLSRVQECRAKDIGR